MLDAATKLKKDDLKRLVKVIQDGGGVDFNRRDGAICPVCGAKRCRVTTTSSWCGSLRERFHKCRSCGLRFKSIEVD
jgi:DNA-directed RNA polymerase subunit M/transcription elongation factor TFIIS